MVKDGEDFGSCIFCSCNHCLCKRFCLQPDFSAPVSGGDRMYGVPVVPHEGKEHPFWDRSPLVSDRCQSFEGAEFFPEP
eukprot:6467848-Amphidinium_carterae.1